ncbi:hypothetical protein RUND412_009219 [Rhizina undulata]
MALLSTLAAALLTTHNLITALLILATLFLLDASRTRFRDDLKDIPGPQLAKWSNLYRTYITAGRGAHDTALELHKRYGKFVRYGPKVVLIADGDRAVKEVYGVGKGFVKSEFYPVQQSFAKGKRVQGIFNTTDDNLHAALKRPISHAYAMSSLVDYEPLVDSTSTLFISRLTALFASTGAVCDFGEWLQWYAFDVIGEMTFSRRLGFLEEGRDVDGIIANLEDRLNYGSIVGQMPFLDRLLGKNPLFTYLSTPTSKVVTFALARVSDRLKSPPASTKSTDFLSKFLQSRAEKPDTVKEEYVVAWCTSNVFAGSDTTAISLRAIFHYLLKKPSSMQKLVSEIDALELDNDTGLVSWAKAREMKYLDAVVKEALRLHPAVGLPLERIVPKGGREVCGRFFREGTVVGVNAWAVHRDPEVFGKDAEVWRPERWLCGEGERKRMDRALLAFGAGSRTCLGKNISLLEMFKLVPLFLRTFEIELANPEKDLKYHNNWFVKQTGLNVRLKRRVRTP